MPIAPALMPRITLDNPTAIAYVSEKPMYRMEMLKAVPPIPYPSPSAKDSSIGGFGASVSTSVRSQADQITSEAHGGIQVVL